MFDGDVALIDYDWMYSAVGRITCERNNVTVLLEGGEVYKWEFNDFDRGGMDGQQLLIPQRVEICNVRKIVGGHARTFAILDDGEVYAWGLNQFGQLGIGNMNDQSMAKRVKISNVRQIVCGGSHTVALIDDGEVYAWGNNSYGQLGIGNRNDQTVPQRVEISNVRQIECGGSYTVAILDDGKVYAWGSNKYGQLGIVQVDPGNRHEQLIPQRVEISNVRAVVCGSSHTVALIDDGEVYAWGNNSYGQLGIGNRNDRTLPKRVEISNVRQIECGGSYTVAILDDGEVYAWGSNKYGQLGIGNIDKQLMPQRVEICGVSQVVCSTFHTVAILDDGEVYAWGNNKYCQLGIGNTDDQVVPKRVEISNVRQVSCEHPFSVAILDDGSVYTWGSGRLSTSNTKNQSIPRRIKKNTLRKHIIIELLHDQISTHPDLNLDTQIIVKDGHIEANIASLIIFSEYFESYFNYSETRDQIVLKLPLVGFESSLVVFEYLRYFEFSKHQLTPQICLEILIVLDFLLIKADKVEYIKPLSDYCLYYLYRSQNDEQFLQYLRDIDPSDLIYIERIISHIFENFDVLQA